MLAVCLLLALLLPLAVPTARAQTEPGAARGSAASAAAANRVDLRAEASQVALSPQFWVLEDDAAKLDWTEVLSPHQQARFRPAEGASASGNFGLTRSAYWLRLRLDPAADAPPDWLLEVAYPALDLLDVYIQQPGADAGLPSSYRRLEGGDLRPFAARAIPHRNHVLPLRLEPGMPVWLYLRVESQGTVAAPARLWRPLALWQRDLGQYATLSLYFGLLLGLFLYNLLLFFAVGDRGYLIYVLFVAGMGTAQAALTGMGAQFLWPDWPWWTSVSAPAGMAVAAAFGVGFARNFLASPKTMPRMDRLLLALVLYWLACLGAALGLPYIVSTHMITIGAGVSVAALVAAGVVGVRLRHPGAQYFLTAWAVLLLGVTILTLHNTGVLPTNAFTANGLLIGSALEMVLLSFALADRINTERRAKVRAQAESAAERRLVEALQASQQRYRSVLQEREAILDSARVGIALAAGDGRLLWVNRALAQLLQVPAGSLVGRLAWAPLADLSGLDPLAERAVTTLAARGELYEELQLVRGDGSRIWAGISLSPLRAAPPGEHDHEAAAADSSGPRADSVWTFLDITERKHSEQQTRDAVERQRQLNALKSRFIAMSSHEFRTPLAIIRSAYDVLLHYGETMDAAERAEVLQSIEQAVKRMSGMIDRVLMLGRSESEMLDFAPRPLDLERECRRWLAEVRAQFPQAPVELVLDYALPPQTSAAYDDKLLHHIFGNLLSNAVKYSPQGGRVRLAVDEDGGWTRFVVSDQGIGIPPAEAAHLFETFHRASNVGTIPGTGLGLAIVKQAVLRHGGSIDVESRPGEGTRFVVRLPRDAVPPSAQAAVDDGVRPTASTPPAAEQPAQ